MSYHRADIAAVLIFVFVVTLLWSIYHGVKVSRLRDKEQVFGDPERTSGGWYWAVCGIATIMLLWFYYSWGMARAYFPKAANELCQVAKVNEALSPIVAQLPIGSRYFKSTDLVVRNMEQLDEVEASFPNGAFTAAEEKQIYAIIAQTRALIGVYSNPSSIDAATRSNLQIVVGDIQQLTSRIQAGPEGLQPTAEALAQAPWGVGNEEIPMLPMTPRGVMFDGISQDVVGISKTFLTLRNMPAEASRLIDLTRADIANIKENINNNVTSEAIAETRNSYLKSVERIFKRLDDGMIFPANTLDEVNDAVAVMIEEMDDAKGSLGIIDAIFMPGQGVLKTRTICIEQGSSRWLPKPTDVVAKLSVLANPNLEQGGGFKGTRLLWFKWLPVADVVGFFVPDGMVDILPGSYGKHDDAGRFVPTYKDRLLAFAKGEVYLG
ncbi:ABC transporter permease, partial [Alphaproteobacteria bacterium]|nr:ABC transporter permease [Alphaproteobacteria bacterium]